MGTTGLTYVAGASGSTAAAAAAAGGSSVAAGAATISGAALFGGFILGGVVAIGVGTTVYQGVRNAALPTFKDSMRSALGTQDEKKITAAENVMDKKKYKHKLQLAGYKKAEINILLSDEE